jgi:hypothetical protein
MIMVVDGEDNWKEKNQNWTKSINKINSNNNSPWIDPITIGFLSAHCTRPNEWKNREREREYLTFLATHNVHGLYKFFLKSIQAVRIKDVKCLTIAKR